jgi:hypothetical protein
MRYTILIQYLLVLVQVQYDTVQKALEKRCTVIQRMKQQMLSRLTQVHIYSSFCLLA